MIPNPASFRDPAATVYTVNGTIFREIRSDYFETYVAFTGGLYTELVDQELIIPYRVVDNTSERIVIAPEVVPFISYPYEWNFGQLKEAALTTLEINRCAMMGGLMLKDASAYNIQPVNGKMKLIDTTSFMTYSGDTPWPSYGQFLRHFVCPLLWLKYYNPYLLRLSEIYLDGIPVALTERMLPFTTRFKSHYWSHIYLQAMGFDIKPKGKIKMPKVALEAFLVDLYKFIEGLNYKPVASEILGESWVKYGEICSYTKAGIADKKEIVAKCLMPVDGHKVLDHKVLDLGANTGDYSRIAAGMGYDVIAVDSDHDCMFMLNGAPGILPLVVDLCNPSPGIGWGNRERPSFWERIGKIDVILALALVHHLSVRNNVPLGMVADLLAAHCDNLIIEWVPLEDKQAQKLLGEKKIPEYSLPVFLAEFGRRFKSIRAFPIKDSGRVIYLMEGKNGLAG
jgi:hypothetical protein